MPSPRVNAWLVKGWRLTALLVAALLLQRTTPTTETILTRLSLGEVTGFFPTAKRLIEGPQQSLIIQDEFGNRLGRLLTTSPDADAIIGYAGPSNVLVALDNQEKIVGTRILSSDDTPDHVDTLRDNMAFERSLKDWQPTSQPAPKLEGYAGSTLTAAAIAESIQKRLSGNYASLRFSTPLALKEIQAVGFPQALSFEANTPRLGWNLVRGPNRALLGYVVRSSPSGDEFSGYAGPTETLIAIEPDALTLRKIIIRESYDTTRYVDIVKEDETYLKQLTKWNVQEWPNLNFGKEKIEGVAGATLTSSAIAFGLQRRFADDAKHLALSKSSWQDYAKSIALWFFLVGTLAMTFTPLHGRPKVRIVWQVLLVGGLGLWLGQLLSLGMFAGWARHGLPWSQGSGLLILGAMALLIPWTTRRQLYCHHACPHGAAQELVGGFRRLHWRLPASWHGLLGKLPAITLAAAFLAALFWPRWSPNQIEPFDAWILGAAVAVPLALAVVGLLASIFIPQAYCKYGCPTGALLKFVRSNNQLETWSRRDYAALGLLCIGALIVFGRPLVTPPAATTSEGLPITEMHGAVFGTTWTVKIRGPGFAADLLKRDIESEVNRIESSLSHWRRTSVTSDFNQLESTQPMGINQELGKLVAFMQKLSEATDGAYDITVAPLVSAWGYGPAGSNLPSPTPEKIKELRGQVGWEKLTLDLPALTLRKSDERLSLDLGSVLQGYADDRIAALLHQQGHHDFLIEVGGELLASGSWHVGIEDPFNPRGLLEKVVLKDQALSPSGLYRAKRLAEGKSISHIISPKTGYPVEPTIEMCCVFHRHCLEADGWATALMAVGFDEAKKLAEKNRLSVILVAPDKSVWRSSEIK